MMHTSFKTSMVALKKKIPEHIWSRSWFSELTIRPRGASVVISAEWITGQVVGDIAKAIDSSKNIVYNAQSE